MNRNLKRVLVVGAVVCMAIAAGCSEPAEEPALEPKLAPPVIAEKGTLRVGVDLGYPPFAGKSGGEEVGLDVDVASALAERLGLKVELVDVTPDEIASALADGDADVALGAVAITETVLADVASAGSYLVNGSAFFSVATSPSAEATGAVVAIDPSELGSMKVGAQQGSAVFWTLEADYGEGFTASFDTLRAAFEGLVSGDVDVVACDAAVGAYVARDFDGVVFSGQLGEASPLGVSVAKDSTELEAAVRETLDALAAEGVLEAIRVKSLWQMPTLETSAP